MTPMVATFFTDRPREIQTELNPWTKLVVPSIGSTMNVGASVRVMPGL